MLRVVINRCYGGFGLSEEATLWLVEHNSELVQTQTFEEYGIEDSAEDIVAVAADPEGFSYRHVRDSLYSMYYGSVVIDVDKKIVYTVNLRDQITDIDNEDDWQAATVRMRAHPDLIKVVELLGDGASGDHAELKIIDIADEDIDVYKVYISEYDGIERVAERHRTWK